MDGRIGTAGVWRRGNLGRIPPLQRLIKQSVVTILAMRCQGDKVMVALFLHRLGHTTTSSTSPPHGRNDADRLAMLVLEHDPRVKSETARNRR